MIFKSHLCPDKATFYLPRRDEVPKQRLSWDFPSLLLDSDFIFMKIIINQKREIYQMSIELIELPPLA